MIASFTVVLFSCTKQSKVKISLNIPLVQIIDEFQQESLQWPWRWLISSFTVEPLYNGHLGDKSKCMDSPPKKMAIVERWPLVEVRLHLEIKR